MAVVPGATGSCPATVPPPPAAPWISKVSPCVTSSTRSTRSAVSAATGSDAASVHPSSAGLGATVVASAYWAYPPPSAKPSTSSPAASPSTPGPTPSTVPAISSPSTAGSCVGNICWAAPERIVASIPFTPAARTRTRTCPAPGSGSSLSATWSTPAGVVRGRSSMLDHRPSDGLARGDEPLDGFGVEVAHGRPLQRGPHPFEGLAHRARLVGERHPHHASVVPVRLAGEQACFL